MPDEPSGSGPVERLLVEDNPGDVRLTEEAFEEGHVCNTPHVVTDGVEALDFLYQAESTPTRPLPTSS